MKAIKNIMIALSGIALLASCDMDKFFELDRPESNPWLSVDDLEYSVADPYNTLFQNPNWQACLRLIRKGLMSRKHFTGILVRCLPLM